MDSTKMMLSKRRQIQRGTENRQNQPTVLDAKLRVVPLENSWLLSRPGADYQHVSTLKIYQCTNF